MAKQNKHGGDKLVEGLMETVADWIDAQPRQKAHASDVVNALVAVLAASIANMPASYRAEATVHSVLAILDHGGADLESIIQIALTGRATVAGNA